MSPWSFHGMTSNIFIDIYLQEYVSSNRLFWIWKFLTHLNKGSVHVPNRKCKYLSRLLTKPTKLPLCPAKTQISLGISPVWSESMPSARRNLWSLATHWAQSEDSDQITRMPGLIWPFTGRTDHFELKQVLKLSYRIHNGIVDWWSLNWSLGNICPPVYNLWNWSFGFLKKIK